MVRLYRDGCRTPSLEVNVGAQRAECRRSKAVEVMGRQVGPWLGEPEAVMLEARVRTLEARVVALEALAQELRSKLAAITETLGLALAA